MVYYLRIGDGEEKVTEATRAEVARAKPAILTASEHFPAKSLKSDWKEQERRAKEVSRPKDLPTV